MYQIRTFRFAVRSHDPIGDFSQFDSPWASSHQDEQFFSDTLKTIGKLVKDDTKLGTLYSTLIFATPGENSSEDAKVLSLGEIFVKKKI